MTLLDAIARMEGWEVPTSRCRRNNNPGNIEWGKFAQAHGAVHPEVEIVYGMVAAQPGRFAVFPTSDLGFGCLEALLRSPGYAGCTVSQAIKKYAPSNENDTQAYIGSVCHWINANPGNPIEWFLPGGRSVTA